MMDLRICVLAFNLLLFDCLHEDAHILQQRFRLSGPEVSSGFHPRARRIFRG